MDALNNVRDVHARTVTQYKRLLEQAHGASAAQLHALQVELRILRGTLEEEKAASHALAMEHDRIQMEGVRAFQPREDVDLALALRGDGYGNFDEIEVRKAVDEEFVTMEMERLLKDLVEKEDPCWASWEQTVDKYVQLERHANFPNGDVSIRSTSILSTTHRFV